MNKMKDFKNVLDSLAILSYGAVIKRGKVPPDYYSGLADISEEIGEAIEAKYPYFITKEGKPEGQMAELADVALATFTLMYTIEQRCGVSAGKAILEKMLYNYTRED